jgi:catechol 2,3-dioxygenase-like lactoylglutathione lyase family enzyme
LTSTPSAGAELFFVEIRADDRAGLVDWYVATLGLSVILDDPAGDFSLLAAGPARLAIKGGRQATAPGSVGLAFRVDDLDGFRARLAGIGIAVMEPEESPEGYRSVELADPMGHPIQVFEWSS